MAMDSEDKKTVSIFALSVLALAVFVLWVWAMYDTYYHGRVKMIAAGYEEIVEQNCVLWKKR